MSTPSQREEWKADSKRIIGFVIGDKIKFKPKDKFLSWSMCTEDPSKYLNTNDIYIIEDIDIRSMSSGLKLQGFEHWFNPNTFELA